MLFSNRDLKKMLYPLVIEQVLVMLVGMVDTVMLAQVGEAAVSGVALVDMVNYLVITVMAALTTGGSVILSQYLGSGQPGKASFSAGQLMTASAMFSTGIMAVCLALPVLLRFCQLEPETLRLAALLIILHNALAIALHPTSFNLANSLRAAGDVKFTMYVGIGSMVVFRLGSAVLFGIVLHWGVVGVWIAMGMDWLARSVAFAIRYRRKKWMGYQVIS